MLKSCVSFIKNNGVFGYSLKFLPKVLSLRGGGENPELLQQVKESIAAQQLDEQIQAILNDSELNREQKRKLVREITKGILGKSLKTQKSWKTSSYRKSLQLAAKHPIYSQVKRKSPFVVMSVPMFHELKRGALARAIGQATIPIKLTTYAGLAMPVFVASSIVEMVVPYKSVKVGCRITKQVVGFPFLVCCLTIDKITEPLEEMSFGQPIPIDANSLMGTMPTRSDIGMLDELMGLKEQAQYHGNLDSLTEATRKKCEELFPNLEPDGMLSSLFETEAEFKNIAPDTPSKMTAKSPSATVDEFEQAMNSHSASAMGENMCPIQAPTYNPGATLGP
jgi:hypothetical protein